MNHFRFLQSPPRSLRKVAPLSGLVLAGLLSACASSSGGGKSASGGKCYSPAVAEPAPASALGAIEFPKSRVWVALDIPESATSEALAKKIPFTLASENKRDVGAPGYATYKVTRGKPTLLQTKEGLEVHVPVNADISVCKKIGSACIQYGSCRPSFLAKFSIETELDDDLQLAPPEGTITATQRCVIGIDVTSQIESIAQAEVAKVEAQIKREWPKFKPEVKRAWKEAEHPIPLADGSCLHVHPDQLFYQRPALRDEKDGQHLTLALGVTGSIQPAADCSTKRERLPLPKPTTKKKAPQKSKLWIPEVVELKTAESELKGTLTGPFGEGELEVVKVRIEKKRVLLHVEASGSVCGSFWLEGKLSHSPGSSTLRLQKVTLSGSSPAPSELTELVAFVEEKAKVELSSADWFEEASLVPLKAGLRAAVPPEIDFDIEGLEAGAARVTAAQDGLYVLHPISARLVVNDL